MSDFRDVIFGVIDEKLRPMDGGTLGYVMRQIAVELADALYEKLSQQRTRCVYCGTTIEGGPGGYHDLLGREVCPADSPSTFHEAALQASTPVTGDPASSDTVADGSDEMAPDYGDAGLNGWAAAMREVDPHFDCRQERAGLRAEVEALKAALGAVDHENFLCLRQNVPHNSTLHDDTGERLYWVDDEDGETLLLTAKSDAIDLIEAAWALLGGQQ